MEYLSLWENGKKKPTFSQVEKVSKATGIPLGYFFLQTPPKEDLSIVDYRAVDSEELKNPSRNLFDTLHDMEQVQAWMHDYLISESYSPLEFIGSMKAESSVEVFSQKVRDLLDIGFSWYKSMYSAADSFNYIRSCISDTGTIVMMSGIVGNSVYIGYKGISGLFYC